ncbi:hypothetical protein Nit79A3_0746 [Nitrosomonas sp. Is79A3]
MQHKLKITNDFPWQFDSMEYALQQRRQLPELPNLFAGPPLQAVEKLSALPLRC